MPLFNFDFNGKLDAKLHVHLAKLPAFVDPKQPPTKKDPWRTINNVPFVQGVDLILPQELYEVIWQRVEKDLNGVRYAKVSMKLQDILNGDFFKEQAKKGGRMHHCGSFIPALSLVFFCSCMALLCMACPRSRHHRALVLIASGFLLPKHPAISSEIVCQYSYAHADPLR